MIQKYLLKLQVGCLTIKSVGQLMEEYKVK